MAFVYGILAFILLFGSRIKTKKGSWHEDFLSLESTKAIQGFCAMTIILHHLSQRLTEQRLLFPFSQIGVLLVGVFFFSSGFGLIRSWRTKENYLNSFLKKRLLVVLVSFYVTTIIYLLIILVVQGLVYLACS